MQHQIDQNKNAPSVNILASGSLVNEAIKAQKDLSERYNINSVIWCVTNYKRLREDALDKDRAYLLNPKNLLSAFFIFSLLFGAMEYIRGTILSGFPWNLIVYSFSENLNFKRIL